MNSQRPSVISANGSLAATALEERLDRSMARLRASRRKLIEKILEDSEQTYFLSSRELARRYNVDVGTIVRTTQALGYERYADFASDLRAHFVVRITPYTVMKAVSQRARRSISDHIRNCIQLGTNNLGALHSEIDPRHVIGLARKLNRARKIVVIGVDLAVTLSYYFSYLLVGVGGFDAEAPLGSATLLKRKVGLLGSKDLLIAISFGRCLRATVDAAIHAGENGVPTFGITDSNRSPIAKFCNASLIVPTSSAELSFSYVGAIAAIEAVLAACVYLNPKRTVELQRQNLEEDQRTNSRWFSPGEEPSARRIRAAESPRS
jgi:DNA-binding MurR/RpiR family transcriptional regulator